MNSLVRGESYNAELVYRRDDGSRRIGDDAVNAATERLRGRGTRDDQEEKNARNHASHSSPPQSDVCVSLV